MSRSETPTVTLTVVTHDGSRRTIVAPRGANLRLVLLEHELSPYTPYTRAVNCGGRGLCATCGVDVLDGEPDPVHWHDRAAKRFGYPRLSCQLTLDGPMSVTFVDKIFWGSRLERTRE